MTGTEYYKLSENDKCVLTQDIIAIDNTRWHKGDMITVAYRDRFQEKIYFYNPKVSYKENISYTPLPVNTCLRALKVVDTKSISIDLEYKIGDTVYFMYQDKIHEEKIERINISICDNTTHITYYIRFLNTTYNNRDFEFFKTKKELIDYLNDE
jgi:hypothetical protein